MMKQKMETKNEIIYLFLNFVEQNRCKNFENKINSYTHDLCTDI